jgi:two-component system, OmpR family, phosphate regulon response regulator PhoB
LPDGGAQILIVEDDIAIREILESALTKAGYRVLVAENGLEALVLVDQAKPKPMLLIVDIMMPELDGLTLVKALKTRSETRGIPVMVITAKSDSRTVAEGISAGAKYYVTKPFIIDDLLNKVRKVTAGQG